MQRFEPVGAAAAARHLGGLLLGKTLGRKPSADQPGTPQAKLPPASVGLQVGPDGWVEVSPEVASLMSMQGAEALAAPDEPDTRFEVPQEPVQPKRESDRKVRAAEARSASITAAAAATTNTNTTITTTSVSREAARFQGMTLHDLLAEVARCAASYGDSGCMTPGAAGVPRYDELLGDMAAALQARPERRCDLAHLQNAYFALRTALLRLRQLVIQIRAAHPELQWVLEPWSARIASHAIHQALALPLGPQGQPVRDPARQAPVARLLDQPLDFHVETLRRRMVEADDERQQRVIENVFRRIYAPGSQLVDGAAMDIMQGHALESLNEGLVRIRCPAADLPLILRSIPAGRLEDESRSIFSFLSSEPTRKKVVYPGDSGIVRVVWQAPDGSESNVLVHSVERGWQSYSTDGGQFWLPTGGTTNQKLESLRVRLWGRFVDYRRQDISEPAWRLLQRGPFRAGPEPAGDAAPAGAPGSGGR